MREVLDEIYGFKFSYILVEQTGGKSSEMRNRQRVNLYEALSSDDR